ncbi:hypothetical protein Hanom_Chr17g01555131 [Helianthus anomalus]
MILIYIEHHDVLICICRHQVDRHSTKLAESICTHEFEHNPPFGPTCLLLPDLCFLACMEVVSSHLYRFCAEAAQADTRKVEEQDKRAF